MNNEILFDQNGPSLQGEIETQLALRDHLISRVAEAHTSGDTESFTYAAQIYEETCTRIGELHAVARLRETLNRNPFPAQKINYRYEEQDPDRPRATQILGACAIFASMHRGDSKSKDLRLA